MPDILNFRTHYWPLPGLYSDFLSRQTSTSLTPWIKLVYFIWSMFYSIVYVNITSSLFLSIYFTVMLLSIISFILIVLTALKTVLSWCTQASEVNFLILQSNFSAIQIGTMICITFIHTWLGIRHSKLQWLPLSGTSSPHSKALLQLLFNFA